MADKNTENQSSTTPPPSYFLGSGFPFVFLPTTFATDFNRPKNSAHVSTGDEPTTTIESKAEKKEKNDDDEEESAETIDDDHPDRNAENDERPSEKNDLRISQPKYSQLLKGLDFSRSRMVDVTNLLSNEFDQQDDHSTSDENEKFPKISNKEKYQRRTSDSSNDDIDDQKIKQDKNFVKAKDEIQNDLNDLAAIIQQASQVFIEKNHQDDEDSLQSNKDLQRKPTFDEDDDTSKQATQNYDLHDTEKEDILPSSKSSKIPRLVKQSSKSIVTTVNSEHRTEKENEELEAFITWEKLINETADPVVQPSNVIKSSPHTRQSHSITKKSKQKEHIISSSSSSSEEEESKPRIIQSTKPTTSYHTYQPTSSSSSDSESVIQYIIPPPVHEQLPATPIKQPTQPVIPSPPRHCPVPSQTLRQDSQATLIDENLDDLSSQLKQVLLDHERQTVNTSTKEERTTDGIGSMSFPISTPDVLSTDILENDVSNRPTDDLLRHFSNQRIDYNQQRQRTSVNIPERTSPPRKKAHHHKHSTTRHGHDGTSSARKADDTWLNMLERLEREHRARLEKQQQEYEDYMHDLEEKMKRRFDDYLTLTNGFQESRLDNHNDTLHLPRRHTSIPIDSNIGRYKSHSQEPPHRPLAKDLISHYYPADSTLNVLTTEKQQSHVSTNIQQSPSTDDPINLRTELTTQHAKHIADLRLYYEYEINELKSQLNRSRMGQTSSTTRQSIETIERINNENIHLHDQVNELRHSLKMTQDENNLLKRQMDELREQLSSKDLDLKKYHRTIADLEQKLTETENTKERQDEKSRHADRQVFLYQEENERFKNDLNFTRERLLRLEERYQEQENENEILRRKLFMLDDNKHRLTDDHQLSSNINFNLPTSRDYGRFTLLTNDKTLSSPRNSPRDSNLYSGRYQSTRTENLFRRTHSPRSMTRISDYLNEKPTFPSPYVAPSRHAYSPRKSSPNRRRIEPMSTRTSADRQTKQTEQLEQKLDQLLKKKRDLETRLSRIPLRGLTNTDRQLSDVLEREIERVEQQVSSIRLELRKSNIIRTH